MGCVLSILENVQQKLQLAAAWGSVNIFQHSSLNMGTPPCLGMDLPLLAADKERICSLARQWQGHSHLWYRSYEAIQHSKFRGIVGIFRFLVGKVSR